MTSQTQEEVTWFRERSTGQIDDDPKDKSTIGGNDDERDQENKEEIHEEDPYVNLNLNNMDALVIDKEKMTSQTREEITWFGERSAGPMDDEPTDVGAVNDGGRDREGEEEIQKDDFNVNEKEINKGDLDVNQNIDNMSALVIDKEKMTLQSQKEITWFEQKSTEQMDDEPMDEGALGGDDGGRDQEGKEVLRRDDLGVERDLGNMDASVINKVTVTSQTQEEVTWFWGSAYNLVHTSRWGGDWVEEGEEQLQNLGGYTMHEIRLLTLGNSCTRCGREHKGSCAIGTSIPSGCSPRRSQ
jgi:hypothetical protein